jgi:Ca2+-transporting ATPase
VNWYQKTSNQVLEELAVNKNQGLSKESVIKAIQKYGKNTLEAKKSINPFKLFISQFKDSLTIILIISASVSLGLSFIEDTSKVESLLIYGIVFAIATVGFFNEYKAEKTVEALKKLVAMNAKVRRDGEVVEIPVENIVPGDIVILEEGQKIPADIRIIFSRDLRVNEASLTGESLPVSKKDSIINEQVGLGDQTNMLFAGTFIASGNGEGVVVCTGSSTELGKIADMVSSIEVEETPMQKKLDDLGKKLGIFIIAICALVFAIVFLFIPEATEKDTLARLVFAFTAAVALAVAAIPEGLAFVVRISLALGARRMASKNALVRKLSSVEALGSTDIICSDKTGTLTRGEMTVRMLYSAGNEYSVSGAGYDLEGSIETNNKSDSGSLKKLLELGALCNHSKITEGKVLGDPTEAALLISAYKNKLDYKEYQKSNELIDEAPFTSERKRMSTLHSSNKSFVLAHKGAVEIVLGLCSKILDSNGKVRVITEKDKKLILEKNTEYAGKALRVLAFAYKDLITKPKSVEKEEKDLVFVGLQAMMDPPRSEVIEVVGRVQDESGIRVVMITGDYKETAVAVAEEIGIKGEAITGLELDELDDEDFANRVDSIGVYARVNPSHKLRIVRALKDKGHQVAMTGDGVNDAPAIKAADIGIAMGITGTDASKEASDLILLDDKFLTIITAIEEGRGIFDNVRKFVNFLISCNIAEVLVVILGIIFFDNLLLTAAQLLFINIVTDGLPAVALGSDPAQKNVLKFSPSRFQQKILTTRVWVEIFTFGILMTSALLFQYWYNLSRESVIAGVSAAFTAMVIYEFVRLVDIRSDYAIRWFSNPWLSVSIVISLALHFSVLYIPTLAKFFKVEPLNSHDWLIMAFGSGALFVSMKLLNKVFDKFGPEH